ncbi:MAG: hypothetical protein ACRDUV_18640 [Pseudonocardiaceae bacterium]
MPAVELLVPVAAGVPVSVAMLVLAAAVILPDATMQALLWWGAAPARSSVLGHDGRKIWVAVNSREKKKP